MVRAKTLYQLVDDMHRRGATKLPVRIGAREEIRRRVMARVCPILEKQPLPMPPPLPPRRPQ